MTGPGWPVTSPTALQRALEAGAHTRVERRLRRKDDPLDAIRATHAARRRDADPATHETAPGSAARLRRCSRFRRSHSRTPDELAVVLALRAPARRIRGRHRTEQPRAYGATFWFMWKRLLGS
jgi:hypothetical protein